MQTYFKFIHPSISIMGSGSALAKPPSGESIISDSGSVSRANELVEKFAKILREEFDIGIEVKSPDKDSINQRYMIIVNDVTIGHVDPQTDVVEPVSEHLLRVRGLRENSVEWKCWDALCELAEEYGF